MTKQRETRERVLELTESLGVGDSIPSERQLGVDLGVSRLTVRAALDELVREGYLVRRRGAGTFVAEPKVAKGIDINSFSDDMRARGMTPASRTLDLAIVPAGARMGRILHVSPAEPVVAVKRLRLADGDPMAIELLHVRQSLVPGMTASDLEENSFYDLLASRYDLSIIGGSQTIESTRPRCSSSASRAPPRGRSSSSRARPTAATVTGWSPSWGRAACQPCRSGSPTSPRSWRGKDSG
jgi:GntR family transcriptional regulator